MMDTGDGAGTRGGWGRTEDGEINEGVKSSDGDTGAGFQGLMHSSLWSLHFIKLGPK